MSRVSTLVLPKVVRLGELGGSTLVQQAMGGWRGNLVKKFNGFFGLFTKGISFFFFLD
jgi:hypothetical protein